ncbi:MAG TPA: LacI family DNA-binding transcriptional regulator [Opitutaceae bacterium]|nr:LacI family DNA-binding transcriptional regulator [Opitutaceae bacterium]
MASKRSRERGLAVKMRDVAAACDVSLGTVSLILNGAPLARYFSPATTERVKKAAQRLGYRPNATARSLRSRRSHAVGVMFFDITDPFCTPVLRGIESALFDASYVPIVTDARNEPPRFERYLEMMLERQVEGLIVVANWLFVDLAILGDLARRNVPTVIVGWEDESGVVSSVMVDNEAGVRLAMEHLYLLGHERIAFIRGPKSLIDSAPRWSGIQKFARGAGREIDSRLVVDLPDHFETDLGFDNAYRLTKELISRGRAFTALVAFDDLTAFGAIRALHESGIKVPEQCSVVGFDDVAPSAQLTPPLTTVRQPLGRMGNMASSIVMDGIRAVQEKRIPAVVRHRLIPDLAIRGSTQRAPAKKRTG